MEGFMEGRAGQTAAPRCQSPRRRGLHGACGAVSWHHPGRAGKHQGLCISMIYLSCPVVSMSTGFNRVQDRNSMS